MKKSRYTESQIIKVLNEVGGGRKGSFVTFGRATYGKYPSMLLHFYDYFFCYKDLYLLPFCAISMDGQEYSGSLWVPGINIAHDSHLLFVETLA